jgi:hypothetical protein
MHEACDYLAVSNVMMRLAAHKVMMEDPQKVREEFISKLVAIIA